MPACPESRQPNASVSRPFVDQQRRDEESGEHEEGVDTQKSTTDVADAPVVRHDAEYGQGSDAIQRGDIRE